MGSFFRRLFAAIFGSKNNKPAAGTPSPAPVPVPAPSKFDGNSHMEMAYEWIDQDWRELPGGLDNPKIINTFSYTTLERRYWHDSTAWCAAAVNALLIKNGFKGTHSALAISFAECGIAVPISQAQFGDIVVFTWSDGSHHVALFDHWTGASSVMVAGGNQGNDFNFSSYPKGRISHVRRPVKS
jgi:uncharacterized protein (TIGR02594 family)